MNSYNFLKKISQLLFFITITALLVSCGGGGDDKDEPSTAPVTAASATLGFDIKTFRFTWMDVSDATFYRLMENSDGASGFTQVGADIDAGTQSFDHIVALYQRINASYFLESCNSAGCTASATTTITGALVDAIGYFKASNTESGDDFGIDVALSADGTTLAVGAKFEDSDADGIGGDENNDVANGIDSGAVYVYFNDSGNWTKQAYIKSSSSDTNDNFGASVSLSADGNILAVGAPQSAVGNGEVHIFTRSGSAWSVPANNILTATPSGADLFGNDVALSDDGTTLAIGAEQEDNQNKGVGVPDNVPGFTPVGAAYIFTKDMAGAWTQQEYFKADNGEASDRFGNSVSLSSDGNTFAVGARGEASDGFGIGATSTPLDNNAADAGAVYVFTRTGGNIWTQEEYIKASDSDAGDNFGSSISLSNDGNTLAVGAITEDSMAIGINGNDSDNLADGAGAAYIFIRSGSNWSQQAYIKASNTDIDDNFGRSISLSASGDVLAVGAVEEQSNATGINGDETNNSLNGTFGSGAAYVYTRSSGIWSQQAYVKAGNSANQDFYGAAIELSGDGATLAVGANEEDGAATGVGGDNTNSGATGSGAVYLY